MQASKAVMSLCICINSPEHSLLEAAVSIIISCADPIKLYTIHYNTIYSVSNNQRFRITPRMSLISHMPVYYSGA